MTPCIVAPNGEIVYEAVDCKDAFNELRKWFFANMEKIETGSIPLLKVMDIDTEKLIGWNGDNHYYLKD